MGGEEFIFHILVLIENNYTQLRKLIFCGSEHAQFELLLKQLVGSQDSIQASKDWVVSRLGHYGVNIAWRLRVFAKETEVAAGGEGPKALPRSKVIYGAGDRCEESRLHEEIEKGGGT